MEPVVVKIKKNKKYYKELAKSIVDFQYDINGTELSFNGNTNLKGVGTKLAYTEEHIDLFMKCANDWQFFAENFYKILSLTDGMIIPTLRDYQVEMIDNYVNKRFNIVLATRQAGKSTSFEIFVCWLILFHKDQRVAILANKAEQSRDILRKIKEAYELLPMWLKQGVKQWNVGSIRLENGSMVIASSTSSTAIRGRSISCLIIDERAFIPHNLWDSFLSSVYPTVSSSPTSRVIYVSTFNGLNHFYRDWNDSVDKKTEFTPIRVDWWQVPGRDEKWKDETISNIGQTRFNQEYGNQALGSITTLIEPKVITELKHATPIICNLHDKFTERILPFFNVYEDVKKGHQYVIGVDSAKMTEDNAGDALGMQVLDISSFPIRQVATFYVEKGISYLQAPEIIFTLGTYYNTALVFVENNEIGQEVANMLHFDLEYDNVYFEKGSLPGFRTTKKTKRLGCDNLKLLIENCKLILNDFNTISQLSTFVKRKMSYEAEKGYKDDLIMSLIASIFFLLAEGLDVGLIENNSEFARIIGHSEVKEDDTPLDIVMPDDELEIPKGDFHWL